MSAATHHSNIDYNLFEGYKVHGKPVKVFVRGQLVVDGEQLLAVPGSGDRVHRTSPLLISQNRPCTLYRTYAEQQAEKVNSDKCSLVDICHYS